MDKTEELWQGYDEQGYDGESVTQQAAAEGALHGSSHVWIWRRSDTGLELLLQKRSSKKRTWPGFMDISAAVHINFGELPLIAALRETREEIGLDLQLHEVRLLFVHRAYMVTDATTPTIENEFRWVYGYELTEDRTVQLLDGEVELTEWIDIEKFKQLIADKIEDSKIVPQGDAYFISLLTEIGRLTATG